MTIGRNKTPVYMVLYDHVDSKETHIQIEQDEQLAKYCWIISFNVL